MVRREEGAEEDGGGGREGRGEEGGVSSCDQTVLRLCSGQILHPTVSASCICLLLACCSKVEDMKKRWLHGSDVF